MVLEMAGKTDPNLFLAGAGRTVITPPVGFTIQGPDRTTGPAEGIADDLLARAVVFESKGERVAVISLDVWGLSESLAERIRESVGKSVNADPDRVWLSVTGNGSSPDLWGESDEYRNYSAYLPDQVAGAALMAVNALEPASMGSKGNLLPDVSTFTEGPGRPGNPALFVLAVNRADGSGIARIVNFACPASIVESSMSWTADYPGYASWALEQNGGGMTLFMQSASHDIRPFDWWDENADRSHPERVARDVHAFGLLLATQASNAAAETTQRRNVEIAVETDTEAGIRTMRLGDAYFVSTDKPQPNRFARRFRRDLPHSNTFVCANLSGAMFDQKATFDARAVKRGIASLQRLGAT